MQRSLAYERLLDTTRTLTLNSSRLSADAQSKKSKKEEGKKMASKPRPRGAKRTFLDELEDRENQIREEEEERERKREREAEADRSRQGQVQADDEEEEAFVDVPTIFGDALSVKVRRPPMSAPSLRAHCTRTCGHGYSAPPSWRPETL
jgi:hypothetical protein